MKYSLVLLVSSYVMFLASSLQAAEVALNEALPLTVVVSQVDGQPDQYMIEGCNYHENALSNCVKLGDSASGYMIEDVNHQKFDGVRERVIIAAGLTLAGGLIVYRAGPYIFGTGGVLTTIGAGFLLLAQEATTISGLTLLKGFWAFVVSAVGFDTGWGRYTDNRDVLAAFTEALETGNPSSVSLEELEHLDMLLSKI